ncbi:PREDICTED: uncharacterized protein LOC104805845 [Tarenaya hassleriana]|uniref:uncharacterized protein LOC104805845 n=1 Tax=Tarenaya hassleriana TaxID=28532 RepID=UPI00053C29EB|nr:PREDICTED: uncharacterized protein LOC104805845 [Tarenaya hassleriana]
MVFICHRFNFSSAVGASSAASGRRRVLERVDKELSRGNYESALSLIKQSKTNPHGLRAFGSVKLVPRKSPFFDINGSNSSELRSLVDSVVDSIRGCIESTSADEISSDKRHSKEETGSSSEEPADRFMVVQHESGHFLVGYLLGVLPRRYEIPKSEALRCNDSTVTGRVEFVGFEFLKEVGIAKQLMKDDVLCKTYQMETRGKISSKILNSFSCVILGGLVTEHMLLGYSEGLHSDVDKLLSVLRWLGFTETEAKSHIRWAASNTAYLLLSHKDAREKLAEAMAMSKSVGYCIETIETAIFRHQI